MNYTEERKRFVQVSAVSLRFDVSGVSGIHNKGAIYINPEKIISVEPYVIIADKLPISIVKLEETEEIYIKGDADEFMTACNLRVYEFEGWDFYDEMNILHGDENDGNHSDL